MNCRKVKKNLVMFLENLLPASLSVQIKQHLDSCVLCNKEKEALIKSWQLLDNLVPLEPSPDFSSRFYKRLAEEESQATAKVWSFPRLIPRLAPALVTAIILLVFINLYLTIKPPTKKSPVGLPAASTKLEKEDKEENEVIENLELLESLEMFEDLDTIEAQESLEGAGLAEGA